MCAKTVWAHEEESKERLKKSFYVSEIEEASQKGRQGRDGRWSERGFDIMSPEYS